MPGSRGDCLVVCPLPPDVNIKECKNTSTAKLLYLPQPLPHAKALRHKSLTSSESKEAKKLSESRITLRNNSKTLERCENNFAWHFWRKKWNMFLMFELYLKEHGAFWTVSLRRSAWTAPNDDHCDKFSVLFRSFLQQLKAKNLSMIALLQTLQ